MVGRGVRVDSGNLFPGLNFDTFLSAVSVVSFPSSLYPLAHLPLGERERPASSTSPVLLGRSYWGALQPLEGRAPGSTHREGGTSGAAVDQDE